MPATQTPPLEAEMRHVNGPRPTPGQLARKLADVAVALPLSAMAPLVRRWHLRWGATDGEVRAVMPGDELVAGCQLRWTRAITIAAPPRYVWPWLVQVGFGKAGFYSNDLLDNAGHPSADQIVDEFQHPAVGEWVPMFNKVNETTAFRVAAIKPEAELVWAKPNSTWSWRLTEADGGTRLVTRLRMRRELNHPAGALLSLILTEFGDFPMMRRMLLNIKQRAERKTLTPSLLQTPFGIVEYAVDGDGPPVLIIHGVLGGYDFGLGPGHVYAPPDRTIIAPSRFGYLGSPVPADSSAARQADALAALLDHLNIPELDIVAFSAGSTSAVHLALGHPSRVRRLVLVSPNAPHATPLPKPPRILAPLIFSQPVFATARRFARSRLQQQFGTPTDFDPDTREQLALDVVTESLFPIGPRAAGTIHDTYIGNPEIDHCAFERIDLPVLVVAAKDDTLAPYKDTRAMTERIPGARLITVPRGGHTLTHLHANARHAINEFLRATPATVAPSPVSHTATHEALPRSS